MKILHCTNCGYIIRGVAVEVDGKLLCGDCYKEVVVNAGESVSKGKD